MTSDVSTNKAIAIVRSKVKGTKLIEAIAAALDEAFQDGCECQRTEAFLARVVAKQPPVDRTNYVLIGYHTRPRDFHEGVWDGFHCNADEARAAANTEYRDGVENGHAKYMLGGYL